MLRMTDRDGWAREPWHTLESRPVYANPWIRVREDVARMPDGRTTIYGVVECAPAVGSQEARSRRLDAGTRLQPVRPDQPTAGHEGSIDPSAVGSDADVENTSSSVVDCERDRLELEQLGRQPRDGVSELGRLLDDREGASGVIGERSEGCLVEAVLA